MVRIALLVTLATPDLAVAQILSPGPLGRGHADLEGLGKCTSCHELGEGVEGARCLKCHQELDGLIKKKRGLHAKLGGRECTSCHQDHNGRKAELSDWGGTKKKLDHKRTGWPLKGKHAAAECGACHRALLVQQAKLKTRLKKNAESTFLGLGTQCTSCHFDEHRGQLGKKCGSCHDEKSFAPASGFEHKESWKLRGAHARIECKECHPSKADTARSKVLPPARADGYAHYDIGKPKYCTTCHRDVHHGKFGRRCERCHDETSWRRIRGTPGDVGFHDKTRFPLLGKHRQAKCEGCHPRAANGSMKTKGLRFATCADCHLDAHLGQLADSRVSCEPCHDVNGYYPPRYAIERHQKARFPLEGAHRAVACNACHPADSAGLMSRVPKRLRRAKGEVRGNELINFTRFVFPDKKLDRCVSCHRDPHRGQFSRGKEQKRCESCHTVTSFRETDIDHERDTTFSLKGKHQKVACAACHRANERDGPILYRGAPKSCSGCHTDPHLGQFGSTSAGGRGCEQCHDVEGFKPTTFDHTDELTNFTLTGAHVRLKCDRCHPSVKAAPGILTRWYRGVPRRCDGCHDNIHARTKTGRKLLESADADCQECHQSTDWQHVRFDHENTRLPLRGRHSQLVCRACHDDLRGGRMDPRCQSCHRDPHGGRLGQACARCHDATSFRDGVGVAAHGQSRFPLYGRHAMVPCDECHRAQNDTTMGGVPSRCESCHMDAYLRTAGTGFDHAAAGIGTGCRRCHNTVTWQRGVLPEHDRCFPLTRGKHRGIKCIECHTTLPGVAISGCDSFSASCVRCHSCARMDKEHLGKEPIPGYQCTDRKCYECHPAGKEDG